MYNLILGSGGVRGFSQIGVIRAIEKLELPIDKVCGVSIGALIGAFYTNGWNSYEIENWLIDKNFYYLILRNPLIVFKEMIKYQRFMPPFTTKRIVRLILDEDIIHRNNFYVAIANRTGRKTEIYNNTSLRTLEQLLSATAAIPAFFEPIFIDGCRYCDGGTYIGNCPVDIFNDNNTNIAIQISKPSVKPDSVGLVSDMLDSIEGLQYNIYLEQLDDSKKEIIIEPDCTHVNSIDFHIGLKDRKKLIDIGYKYALQCLKGVD